jgi:molybdenum cofactor guanylyltransferase
LTKIRMSAVILAGGKSSRMGENKLILPLGDTTIVGHLIDRLSDLFTHLIVVTDHPEPYSSLPVVVTGDLFPCRVKNSLVGIHGGLMVSPHPYNLVVAGDMPFLSPALLKHLCAQRRGYDIVIPQQGNHLQPLCAVYHKRCLPHIERLLSGEHYKITDLLDHVRVCRVDAEELKAYDTELLSFFNLNTPEDYLLAQKMFLERHIKGVRK